MKKVLIITPTHEFFDYCLDLYVKGVEKLIENTKSAMVDVFIIDNSVSDNYSKKIGKLLKKSKVQHIPFGECELPGRFRKFVCLEVGRQWALIGGYDYILVLDNDIILPPMFIDRAINHDKDCVQALNLYRNDHGVMENGGYWGNIMCPEAMQPKLLKDRYEAYPVYIPIQELRKKGQLIKCYYGASCCLIKKEVFSKVGFRVNSLHEMYNELPFVEDMIRNDFEQWVDTDMVTVHLNKMRGGYSGEQSNGDDTDTE